ncbi:hypothetical protein BJ875DRAFT_377564 [Amylocarpus encephaloides]|uniref:AMP-dependent synthetase/ligase domain-containing protein n=1 Tax=Amylocarpus encephaloides TaxID=45428 RepID=A0A9P7YHK0_9HELO|nr:hypothetical protein BJ875DRAFT_377564 [Amylocarpus encephaloides]
MDNLMLKLDEAVTGIVGQWDLLTSLLFGSIISFFIYTVINYRDPDAHPMLLARQSQASLVRQEGESAVFRSHSSPHGMPLNSGLGVKDPGDSKWSRGRDGDLRDVWRGFVAGKVDREGKETGEKGKLLTILGSEKVVEHETGDINRQINLIGQHIKQNGGKNVAIYLPNSVEFIATLFSCSFYDLMPILVPYDQPIEKIISLLHESKADAVVAAVGSFPFDVISKSYPALEQLIWVVDEGSKHMDWNEVPKGIGGPVNVSTWQEIIQDAPLSSGNDLPAVDRTMELKNVRAFWPSGELVEYTQANVIAGIAGQLTSVPTTQRIVPSDLVLPVDSLSTMYTLVLTLSALYSNASVALNSVAGESPDLVLATQGLAPTIIIVTGESLAKVLSETAARMTSPVYGVVHWFQTRSLVEDGTMPNSTVFSRFFDSLRPKIGTAPGKLRNIYVSEQIGAHSTPLSAQNLSDLRIYTGARIIYALASSKVAGAVTQSGVFDYRIDEASGKYAHFGAPVTSVEVFLKDTKDYKTTDGSFFGEIHVRGPAVVGEEVSLGANGTIKEDYTLALL